MNPTPWEEPAGLALQVADALFTLPGAERAAATQHLAGVDPSAALESLLAAILQAGPPIGTHQESVADLPAGARTPVHSREVVSLRAASEPRAGADAGMALPADMLPGNPLRLIDPMFASTGIAGLQSLPGTSPGQVTVATDSPPRQTPPVDPRGGTPGSSEDGPVIPERTRQGAPTLPTPRPEGPTFGTRAADAPPIPATETKELRGGSRQARRRRNDGPGDKREALASAQGLHAEPPRSTSSAPDGAPGNVTRTPPAQWPATASRLSTRDTSATGRPATAASSQILADASRKTRLVSGVADLNGLFESLLAGRRPADTQAAVLAGTRREAPVAAEGEPPGAAGRHPDLSPASLAEAAPVPRAAPLTRADWPATAALMPADAAHDDVLLLDRLLDRWEERLREQAIRHLGFTGGLT